MNEEKAESSQATPDPKDSSKQDATKQGATQSATDKPQATNRTNSSPLLKRN